MKKIFFLAFVLATLASCAAPVIRKDVMQSALIGISLREVTAKPELYKGKTLILGGLIVNTRVTERGSQIEAVYVPTDAKGYLKGREYAGGRFLALLPKENGFLDPLIFSQGREITVAGEFLGTQGGKIDEMSYSYPLFEIREIYLWEEQKYEAPYYPPYPYYYPPYWYDPWMRPYPPWW